MDFLKQMSRPLLFLLLGIVIVVIALSKSLQVGSVQYTSSGSTVARIGLAVLGFVIILGAGALQLFARQPPGQTVEVATSFLQTLDDLDPFENLIDGADRVTLVVRTGINILMSYERALQSACAAGCTVRFIFVNPTSPAAQHLYGGNSETYSRNLATSAQELVRLQRVVGQRLTIRTTNDLPPFSMILIEKAAPDRVRVQLNFLHTKIGRDRPVFELSGGEPWHRAFEEEVAEIWKQGDEWVPSNPRID